MQPVVPNDDYSHGQMMGMLVVIMMLEDSRDSQVPIPAKTIEKIKKVAVENLAQYLDKPEEDVTLLVETELRNI